MATSVPPLVDLISGSLPALPSRITLFTVLLKMLFSFSHAFVVPVAPAPAAFRVSHDCQPITNAVPVATITCHQFESDHQEDRWMDAFPAGTLLSLVFGCGYCGGTDDFALCDKHLDADASAATINRRMSMTQKLYHREGMTKCCRHVLPVLGHALI